MTSLWVDVRSWLLANSWFWIILFTFQWFWPTSSVQRVTAMVWKLIKAALIPPFGRWNAPEIVPDVRECGVATGFFWQNIYPYVFRLMYHLPFRVSGFVALAIANSQQTSSSGVWHSAPPIYDTPLTLVEGEKLRLVIDLRHVINYFVKLFPLISTNFIGNSSTWVNAVVLCS